MSKEQLILQIEHAFKDVKLEDGIGLWESQALDFHAPPIIREKLREIDIKDEWHKIPLIDLFKCSSALSFFDAKGMRFHLPKFLLFDLDVFEKDNDDIDKNGALESVFCPEVYFALSRNSEENYKRYFSKLTNAQIQCVIDYLYYKIQEREEFYQEFGMKSKSERDAYYKEVETAILFWKEKLK